MPYTFKIQWWYWPSRDTVFLTGIHKKVGESQESTKNIQGEFHEIVQFQKQSCLALLRQPLLSFPDSNLLSWTTGMATLLGTVLTTLWFLLLPSQWAIFCSARGSATSVPWGCPLPLSQLLYELVPSWNWSFSLLPSLHPRQIGNWCERQPWWSLSWLPLFYGTQNIQLIVGYVTHLFQDYTGFSYVCLFLLVPVSPRTIPSLVLGVIEMSNEILLLPSSCRCMCLDLNSLPCRP